jgi:hypothetical protein
MASSESAQDGQEQQGGDVLVVFEVQIFILLGRKYTLFL